VVQYSGNTYFEMQLFVGSSTGKFRPVWICENVGETLRLPLLIDLVFLLNL